jgi:glycosyltransferase involved in cell wall biosynthesis
MVEVQGRRYGKHEMASDSRVTVVVPTYNRAAMLADTVESVLAQTYRDFRVVVADNASTDETAEVVRAYDDERVSYLRRPENVGLFENFQQSLRAVDTEYALLLCDDDLLRPEFLEATVDVLDRQPRTAVVHTSFDVIGDQGEAVERAVDWTYGLTEDTLEAGPRFLAESMRWGCRLCQSAALMRTAALPSPPFRQEDMPAIDFGLWLRLALDWDIAYVARPLAAYRVHGTAESAGLGVPLEAGYRTGVEWIDMRAGVKGRFLDEYGHRLPNSEQLRRTARRGRRFELVAMAYKETLPEHPPLATLRSLAGAAREDLAVATDPAAWRLAAASLLGPRLRGRLRGRA